MAKILFVDDDQDICDLITLRLGIAGHDTTIAENGKIGLEKALAETYDLILMDMHMPVMEGHETVRTLRNRGYTGLIVALTASVMTSETSAAIASGCDCVLVNPISSDFEAQMAKFIEGHTGP